MRSPDDPYTQEELDAMGDEFFRYRYCPQCKTHLPTEGTVPPYSWVHDLNTGEHRDRPK